MYDKTVWIDHIADPNTGEVLQQGTRFDQQKMNNIENGIYDAHTSLQELEDAKVKEFAITLAADQWIDKTYTIHNSMLTSNTSGRLIMGVNSDQAFTELKAARIRKSAVLSSGSLVISASGIVPTDNINLILQVKSVSSNEFIIDLPSDGGDADTLGQKEPAYFASKADYLALLQRIETTEMELEKKIGKDMSPQFFLPANGWNADYQQTLPCDKYTKDSKLMIAFMMPDSNINECVRSNIQIFSCSESEITFACSYLPTTDLVVATMYQGEDDITYEIIDEIGEKEIIWYTKEMLPDPNVLLLLNFEGSTSEEQYKDKSTYSQSFSNVNSKIQSVITGYFKGKNSLTYNYRDLNSNYNNPYLRFDTISNFDPSKEWQLSFSGTFRSSMYGTSGYVNVACFEGLKCGFELSKSSPVSLYFKYLNSNGTLNRINTGISYQSTSEVMDCHIVLKYKQDENNKWNYFIETRYKKSQGSDQSEYSMSNKYSDIKENKPTDSTKFLIGGVANEKDEDYVYSTWCNVDEVVLKSNADEGYLFPTYADPSGGFELIIPTFIKHSKIISITDKKILRKNADGTIDEYRTTVTEVPYDVDSNTIALLHCDELKATDEVGNAITMNDGFVEVDTEKKVFGTSSYKFNRLDVTPNCILTLPTPLKRGMKITFECYVYIDSASIPTGTYNNYLFTLTNSSGQNAMHAFLYKPRLDYPISIEFGVSTAASGGGGRLISYEYSSVDDFVDQWNHVAFTIDLSSSTSKVILYVNGIEMKRYDSSNYIIWDGSFDSFYLGCYPNVSPSNNHEKYFDEICITNGIKTEFVNKKTETEWVRL